MPKDDIKTLLDDATRHIQGRRREATRVDDDFLSPSAESAPGARPRLEPPRPRKKPTPDPIVLLPAPELASDPVAAAPESVAPASSDFSAREAETKRINRRRPYVAPAMDPYPSYVPEPDPPPYRVTRSFMQRAAEMSFPRLLALIAATGAALSGCIAALGAAIVSIIAALRPPSNVDIQKRLDAMDVRVNGDFGVKMETETRQKKDEELEEKIRKLRADLKKLDNSIPKKVRVQVNGEE